MDRPVADSLDPETPFLLDPAAQSLCKVIEDGGQVALFVGGCVRNAVMGTPATDIDIATDAVPARVTALAEAAGFRVIPTGIEHGTVTVTKGDSVYEVTSFRRDVATDGRRAVVAFSTDVADDARRRDFTMNALYADRHGAIIDPLGGLADARTRYVRFIEDPGQRIREDYLRILRFFRFHAQYAQLGAGWDADALDGIASNLDGLETLSAERVGSEMIKLLSAPDPTEAVAVMQQTGVLGRILPGAVTDFLGPYVHLESITGAGPDPMARLAGLGGADFAARLRFSRKDQKHLESILANSTSTLGPKAIGHQIGVRAGTGAILLRAAMTNDPVDATHLASVTEGAGTSFPISANDLPDLSGKELGARLKGLKDAWLDSELTKTRNDLLAS